jgi:hypothetical protein
MKAITATWKNGQVLPDEVADWPEGCRLRIEPVDQQESISMREEDWSTEPEAIADWLAWYDSLEPLEFTAEEEADLAAWRRKAKEFSIAKMNKSVEDMFP